MNARNTTHLFIVEDNKVFQLALKADLEAVFGKQPVVVHSFHTGEECMKHFAQIKPEVVILDYNLNSVEPGAMNGIKILDLIKNTDHDTNVIMLTSEDDMEIAVKSFRHGASDYVVKTETKFRKINFSLYNLFKMIAAKKEARRYKFMALGFLACITILVAVVVAIEIVKPSLIR
jgi:DNA-binding NarL/FixJ family response regulator